jgi:hypothetical protein
VSCSKLSCCKTSAGIAAYLEEWPVGIFFGHLEGEGFHHGLFNLPHILQTLALLEGNSLIEAPQRHSTGSTTSAASQTSIKEC